MENYYKKATGKKKGFTLIELLIVIAILVILAVVVILTLNPAQLLAQARDSQRMSDLATLKSAISLFLADVSTTTPPNCGLGTSTVCFASANITTTTCGVYSTPGTGRVTSTDAASVATSSTNGNINGTGWVPINFSAISSGAPLGREPVDPTNNTTSLFYTFSAGSSCTFKLTAHMESTRYEANGANDVETTDGGISSTSYETGKYPGKLRKFFKKSFFRPEPIKIN
ncbi:MAG: type II secretion system GspH family protein [Patescibacteria group bacterium]|nr:type II secretion system GspH family protein [Patescibacteria group bacterium]